MKTLQELIQTADWKSEKHAPVFEIPEKVKKGEKVMITVSVGKEIPHPNTTEHHIEYIEVFFLPEGMKNPLHVGRFEFSAHGASTEGPNTSTVYAEPVVSFAFKTEKPGTFYAFSFCNIHGLWGGTAELKVE